MSTNDWHIRGGAWRTLVGACFAGCFGMASSVLLSNTRNHLKPHIPLLRESAIASVAMVAAPNLVGSLLRVPSAAMLESIPTRIIHATIMGVSLFGTLLLMILSFIADPFAEHVIRYYNGTAEQGENVTYGVQLGDGVYYGYVVAGILGGCGVAVFSVGIATVAFWASLERQGTMTGTYGGITNVMPGLMGMIFAVLISYVSLGIAYALWAAMVLVAVMIAVPLLDDSPYHQLYYRQLKKHGNVSLEQRTQMRDYVKEHYLALGVYLPAFFVDNHREDVTNAQAGLIGAMYSILAGLTRISGGALSDKLNIGIFNGGVIVEVISMVAMCFSSFMIATVGTLKSDIVMVVVLAIACGSSNGAIFKMLPQFATRAAPLSGVSGWVAGIGAVGGAVWPLVLGILTPMVITEQGDTHGVFWLFVMLSLISFACTVVIQILIRRDEREDEKLRNVPESVPLKR